MTAEDIAKKAMGIAANMCIYTNENFVVKTLEKEDAEKKD
jgi:ATP-dependent protease HslVU (ClpYQ) peptidase subunit